MVETEERELLASLRGYLEELAESGLDDLAFGQELRPAAAPLPAPAGQAAAARPVPPAAGAPVREISGAKAPAAPPITIEGDPQARLVFVMSGRGLAGPSGELLSKIIVAMGFAPEEVCLLAFPEERGTESAPLRRALLEKIAAVAPKVVVALGEQAAGCLLESAEPISALRGRFLDLDGVAAMATLHPDQLLSDQSLKREVWNEMQQVMKRLANS